LFTATTKDTAVSVILLTAVIMLGKSGDWERNAYVAITGCVTVRFCVAAGFYHITDGWY